MKLRNKKTGEIGEPRIVCEGNYIEICVDSENHIVHYYKTLHGMFKEWEVFKDHKEHYFITEYGEVFSLEYESLNNVANVEDYKQIGNYFETKKDAEKVVEKLKAFKRLKDKGVKFKLDFVRNTIHFTYRIDGTLHSVVNEERIIFEDMKTIFGGNDESNQ